MPHWSQLVRSISVCLPLFGASWPTSSTRLDSKLVQSLHEHPVQTLLRTEYSVCRISTWRGPLCLGSEGYSSQEASWCGVSGCREETPLPLPMPPPPVSRVLVHSAVFVQYCPQASYPAVGQSSHSMRLYFPSHSLLRQLRASAEAMRMDRLDRDGAFRSLARYIGTTSRSGARYIVLIQSSQFEGLPRPLFQHAEVPNTGPRTIDKPRSQVPY